MESERLLNLLIPNFLRHSKSNDLINVNDLSLSVYVFGEEKQNKTMLWIVFCPCHAFYLTRKVVIGRQNRFYINGAIIYYQYTIQL